MLLQKLRTETATFHQLAEKMNFSQQLADGSICTNDYKVLLKRLRLFYAQTHALSFTSVPLNPLPDSIFAEKVGLLQSDLAALSCEDLPSSPLFKTIGSLEYLGFCYVSFGSMLGGQIIGSILLQQRINFSTPLPTAFYQSCKESIEKYWQAFTQYLASLTHEQQEPVINGAKICYLYFIYLCSAINE